jgi:hypothetical protein
MAVCSVRIHPLFAIVVLAGGLLGAQHPVHGASADSAVKERARAALPEEVQGLPRSSVTLNDAGPFVSEVQASYDTGKQMAYLVTVTYYASGSEAWTEQRDKWRGGDPALSVDGHPVYKRAYGGMGSGVVLFLEPAASGELPVAIQVRSPRLTDAVRKQVSAEQHSDAPPPEAVLPGMDLSQLRALGRDLK